MFNKYTKGIAFAIAAAVMAPTSVLADSISPTSFEATLGLGESVTIRKTVTVTDAPSSAVLDIMFVFDVTGSMGDEITDAKTAANGILTALGGFGDLRTGSGWYSDTEFGVPIGFDGVHVDLNSGNTGAASGINDMWEGYTPGDPFATPDTTPAGSWCSVAGTYVGCGGDFAELGYAGISDAADSASWRTGSNRFIIALGDASFKTPPTEAATIASLTAADAELIGISYSSSFSSDIADLGGTVYDGGDDPADVAAAIIAAVSASFEEYTTVDVDDLGLGLPGVGVSTVCVSADTGACVGATAVGTYDRSKDRSFDFDVTFTGLEAGVHDFPTYALVDDGIVAVEKDRITVGASVPEPATLALFGLGLIGAGVARRRRG